MPSELDQYTVGRAIGRGHFSVVYKAKDNRSKSLVALKKISLYDIPADARDKTLKEVDLLRMLEHPNIVRCHASFMVEHDLIIVCEFAELGDMSLYLKKLQESGTGLDEMHIWYVGDWELSIRIHGLTRHLDRKLFRQIAHAIQHMHRKRVMHRDIKPSNILMFPNETVKMADLGLGRMLTYVCLVLVLSPVDRHEC
jgi:NIMA (never in mitosis gene a)-related kinase